ncbi:MAG: PAS domain S-box protein [Melioribacteraceae bacterium]|nr:PAS domain S-box protein [Melioribacteraceae bacterium]
MNNSKILIVEDESIVSLEIQGRIEELGYEVAGAVYSGEEAVISARELNPDLILMDINLRGDLDGIEAANQIKSSLNIPIIYMTAYADDETIQRAKISTPYAYIIKPIEVRELHSSIEIALYKSQMEKKLIESESQFRGLFENATLGLYRTSLDGKILMANSALINMLEYDSFEDLATMGHVTAGYVYPSKRDDFLKIIEAENQVIGFESEWRTKNGTIIYISESAKKNIDERGIEVLEGTIENITNKKMAALELKDSKDLLQSVFDKVYDGIFIHDLSGKILTVNKKVLTLFGLSEEEILGQNIGDLVISDINIDNIQDVRMRVVDGAPLLFEGKAKRPYDQFVFDVEVYLSKISMNKKDYILANVRDITEKNEAKSALIIAKDKAEQSDRLKSEFLASMSHEIRTPVNTILSFSSLLKEELYDMVQTKFKDIFQSIEFGGQRLIRTVDSILNMSQIQAGTFEIVKQSVNLDKDILEPAFSEFKVEAKNKGLQLKVIKEASSDVQGDLYSLGQLFTNLVDNAIKYTNKGEVIIKTYKNVDGALCVDISDTGIGISEAFLENLFNPFTQETQGYTRRFDGNGLGLALVKKYCDLNDALITVKSTKNVGSTFTVMFNQNSEIDVQQEAEVNY